MLFGYSCRPMSPAIMWFDTVYLATFSQFQLEAGFVFINLSAKSFFSSVFVHFNKTCINKTLITSCCNIFQ